MMNGRLLFRNALKGKNDGRMPFVPFIYGLAARAANVALEEMAGDATYYANALEDMYRQLGYDAIVINFERTLESEIFGCRVDWPGEFDAPVLSGGGELSSVRAEEYADSGRIPVVAEVAGRLSISLTGETGIVCAVTGMCSLVENLQMLSGGPDSYESGEFIKLIGSSFAKLVRRLCEKRIDALFFREDPLEDRFGQRLLRDGEAYKKAYSTAFNIVKAFDAFPVIVTRNLELSAIADVQGLLRSSGVVLLGQSFSEPELVALKDMGNTLRTSFGVSLPVGTTSEEELWNRLSTMESFVSAHKPSNMFYTSDGKIPHDVEIEVLHELTRRILKG